MEIECEYTACKKTVGEKSFTIPLNGEWSRTDGFFCSVKCAKNANMRNMSNGRPITGRIQREEWLCEKYNSSNKRM